MGQYNIWCERHREPDLVIPAVKLNSDPIPALEFEHAMRIHLETVPDPERYRRRPDGSWVHGELRLYEHRYEAETAYSQAA